MMSNTNPPTLSATLPPGTYVVGDPCYSIPDEKWMEWLEAADYTNNHREHVLVAEVDGRLCVGVSTYFGDGSYDGDDGNTYGVDAGLLGLVPIEVASKNSVGDDRVLRTFQSEVVCEYNGGHVRLGPITIDTVQEDEDEESCDDCGGPVDGWGSLCDDCESIRDEDGD